MANTQNTPATLSNPYTYCRNCGATMDPADPDRSSFVSDGCCSMDCFEIVEAAEFVKLNSNPEHSERRTWVVTNEDGRRFCARLVMPGDRYGAIGHKVGQRDLQPNELCKVNDGQPLIEWYAETDTQGFTPLGQHTGGIYNLATMADHHAGPHRGLCLEGSIPEWTVCADAFADAYRTLVVEQGLDPAFVLGWNNKWKRLERIDHGAALPWKLEGLEYDRTSGGPFGEGGRLHNQPLWRLVKDLDELSKARLPSGGPWAGNVRPWSFEMADPCGDLSRQELRQVANLVKWGLAWRDRSSGRVILTTLGRLWNDAEATTEAIESAASGCKVSIEWMAKEITTLRQNVIDAMDEQIPYNEGSHTDHMRQGETWGGRKRSLDQAKAFHAYLVTLAK